MNHDTDASNDLAPPLEALVGRCRKCGREKIAACEAITGYPGYHVRGSKVEYCGYCDTPPTLILDNTVGGRVLVLV